MAKAYPDTLLTLSVYAFVRGLPAIVFASAIGTYIDRNERLRVVRTSIVGQRVAVAISCIAFILLVRGAAQDTLQSPVLLTLLAALACVEKVCAIINRVSVEKDWVVVVAQSDPETLRALNSQMRRIDLLCKLVGPTTIALLDGISTELAIAVNFGMNVVSVGVEYSAIARVYRDHPRLQEPKLWPHDTPASSTVNVLYRTRIAMSKLAADTRRYCSHEAFLPSFAASVLYLNVLTFGGQMVTYLLASKYTSTHVGVARTFSVILEVSSTWIAPLLMSVIGLTRAGLWSSWWQLSMLVGGVSVFLAFEDRPIASASGLVVGTILSRMGLWSFDLCCQTIVQEQVEAEFRGVFSSMESAVQHVFELLSYTSTMIFFRPEDFKYPAMISLSMVFASNFCYSVYVRRRRGHFFHPEKLCGCGRRGEAHGTYIALANRTSDLEEQAVPNA
ncbi:uncharacterized protein CcaverHIS019_0200050 [Cutaneotrichosporon cavernicola]|uniref:Solute carrier family 40 member n=1 Tax=Cutaneotrichosporon cavernicola TaxID=279322 RepID=A0AA48L2E6_9TREE|nr:uncharacterized protein CcaverHIS019_0200050 [Cutaneotrichosporon cavernicola]BEI88643.1 hypothetical protein CcaverHIS019_0200050 [Cutaneotrichosporon cavernicola]BEJ04188.1 hypothetical protein CcaverHIS641_0200050 [Cutaneotrichosporon cavernicola]